MGPRCCWIELLSTARVGKANVELLWHSQEFSIRADGCFYEPAELERLPMILLMQLEQ